MFDPEWTATYAAQFLRTLYEERGDWSAAAGRLPLADPGARAEVPRRASTLLAGPPPRALTDAEALVAAVAPRRLRGTRAERREAQRRAMAERIRARRAAAAARRRRHRRRAARPRPTARCSSQGAPLLGQGQPLLAARRRPLF